MSAFEYLTVNSLTAYPFRDGRAENLIQPISSDTFLDIVFVLYSANISRPYIKQIRSENGAVSLDFHDVDGDALIFTVDVPAVEAVSHYKNKQKSFFGYRPVDYYPKAAVKLVFGEGLQKIKENALTVDYTPEETELSPSAVQYSVPEVSTVEFESWFPDFDSPDFNPLVPQEVISVKTFLREEDVGMHNGHNNVFNYLAPNTMYLDILRGAGAGLYDPCGNLPPYDVITKINQIAPDPGGNMFFKVSDCHALRLLTDDERSLALERIAAGGTDYVNFKIPHYLYLWEGDVREDYTEHYPSPGRTVNILGTGQTAGDINCVNHGFVLENFCKPKCPHENLNAFAEYLNRVKDGVSELFKVIENPIETGGKARIDGTLLTATSFCQDLPDGWLDGTCGTGFKKYFHEGRRIRIRYNNITSYNVDIVEVLEAVSGPNTQIRIAEALPQLSPNVDYTFKVSDLGILDKFNAEVLQQNTWNITKNSPYLEFNYSTVEAFNGDGNYVTFITTIAVVYNPGTDPLPFQVNLTTGNNTTFIPSSMKIRRETGLILYGQASDVIPCKSYAIFESIFYIPCGNLSGSVTISVVNANTGGEIENSPKQVLAQSAGCVQINVGTTRATAKENQFWGFNFATTNLTTAQILSIAYSGLPTWVTQSANNREGDILPGQTEAYHLYGTPTATAPGTLNQDYSITASITTGDGVFVTTLLLSYLAKPRITSPLGGEVIEIRPPDTLNRTFTEGSPLIKITATNKPTSYNFRSAFPAPGFFAKGGKLAGKYGYSPETTFPIEYTYKLVAKNEASLPELGDDAELGVDVKVKVYDTALVAPNALQGVPYCFNIPNPEAASLSLLSTLPTWLSFNADPAAPGCNLTGTNNSSTSTTERFIIRYDYGNKFENLEYRFFYLAKPTILAPAVDGAVIELRPPDYMSGGESTQFTSARPVLKIQAANLPTDITATGLPEGLEVVVQAGQTGTQKTAVVVGKIASGVVPNDYLVTITAENAAGGNTRTFVLRLLDTAKAITALEGTNFCYQFSELAAASEYGVTWDPLHSPPPWLNAVTPPTNTKVACHFFTAVGERAYGELSQDIPFVLRYASQSSPGIEFNVAYVLKYIAKPRILIPSAGETFTIASTTLADEEFTAANPLFTLDVQNTPATYQISGLPAGLSLLGDKVVGKITGTSGLLGEYLCNVTATNLAGKTTTTFKVILAERTVEQAYQDKFYCYKVRGMSGVTSYTYTGDKPAWLTFNPSSTAVCPTGNFYGTPGPENNQNLLGDAGFKFSVQGLRAGGSIEQDFRLDYYAKPVITYPAPDTVFTVAPPDYNATLFSSVNPLFRISATNNPTSFRVAGFQANTFRVDNFGNLIGSSGVSVNDDAPREILLYATNPAGESQAVRVYFVVTKTTKTITFNSGNTTPCSPEARYQFSTSADKPSSISLTGQPSWITFNPDMTSQCNLTFDLNPPALTAAQTIPLLLTRNYVGGKTVERFNLLITAPPIITNPTPATNPADRLRYVITRPDFNNRIYTATQPLLTVTAKNDPTSITSTGLPPGLRMVAAGADMGKVVSTTETTKVTIPGLYEVSVVASNSAGPSETVTFEIEVKDEDVEVYTRQGTPVQSTYCKLSTRDRATSYSIVSGALLSGLGFTGSIDASCNFYGVPVGNNFDVSVLEIRSNYVGGFSNFNFKFIHLNYPTIVKFTRNGLDVLDDVLDIDPGDYIGVQYTEENPLFVVETTGNPTSFYVEGFPLDSSLTVGCSGKIVGTIPASAAGVYIARVVAVNEAGESSKKAITLNLSKTIPTITWPTPDEIIYGTPLNLIDHLNAVASVAGTFVYDPPAGTILNASDQSRALKVTFTPTDLVNYSTTIKNNTIKVSRAIPQLVWDEPAAISYYTPLSTAQLNAAANVPGSFVYSPSIGSRLSTGQQTLTVAFTPEQPINYVPAQRQVILRVEKITVTPEHIYWNTPSNITFGTALSGSQLNAVARISTTDSSSPGITSNSSSYVYSPPIGTVLAAGTHTLTVTFTSSDSLNFTVTPTQKTVTIQVLPQTLQVSWNNPAAITYGTALSSTQLNASSSVSGLTFTYDPAVGTVLNAGAHTLSLLVSGNPNYSPVTLSRNITVNKASSALTITSVASGAVNEEINITSTKTGSSGAVTYSSQTPTVVSVNGDVARLLRAGTGTITATLAGDANFNGVSVAQTIAISRGTSTITITSSDNVKVANSLTLAATVTGSTAQATFQSSDTSRLSISGTTARGVKTGIITVTASVAADANFNATSQQQVFTVNKGDSSLAITSSNTGTEGNDVAFTTTKTGSTGSVTFTSGDLSIVQPLTVNTMRLGVPGSTPIVATLQADDNYLGATAQQSFTVVAKRPSTVTYSGVTTGFVGGFITLSATKTGSTGAVTFVSQNAAIALVTGTQTLSLLTPGTATILATLAADSGFKEATTSFTVTVDKKSSTLSLSGLNAIKIGQTYTLTATKTGSTGSISYVSSDPGIATVSNTGVVTLVSPGTVTFTATLADDSLFWGTTATKVLTVNKGASSLSVTGPTTGKVGTTSNLTYSVTGTGGAVTIVPATDSGITVTSGNPPVLSFAKGGTRTVTVSAAADTKYEAVSKTHTISVSLGDSSIGVIEHSLNGTTWTAGYPSPVNFESVLFLRPVVTGSTGAITLTTSPGGNLETTTQCTSKNTGVCSAKFKFIEENNSTQSFTFTVASDGNYAGASASGTISINPKPPSTIVLELNTGGAWFTPTTALSLPRGSTLSARPKITGSGGYVLMTSNPTTNVTLVQDCTGGRTGTCSVQYQLDYGTSQTITAQVFADTSYKGASTSVTVSITG